MPVTINGTTGISTPGQANTGNETITGTLGVTGATTLGAATATSLSVGGVAAVAVAPGTSGNVLTSNGTTWTSTAPTSSGTVTSVATGTGLTGGTITTSGTISMVTTAGAVGTYVFANVSGLNIAFGATVGGASVAPSSASFSYAACVAVLAPGGNGPAQSGTWRCMGNLAGSPYTNYWSLFMRIA